MQITTFTKKLTDIEKDFFEEYLHKKLKGIEKFVQEFDDDAVKLHATAEKFTNKNAYKVELWLEVPKASSKPLYAGEDSHDLGKAIDFSKDKLVDQLKKAMGKLHHQHLRAT